MIYQTTLIPHMNAINCDVETQGNASMLRMKIYNNTIVSIDQYGIQIGDRGNGGQRFDGLDIRNNIVIDCGTYTQTGNISVLIDTSGGIPKLIIDYNLVGEYNLPRANY